MSDPNAFDRVSPAEDANWQASWETEDNYCHENFTSPGNRQARSFRPRDGKYTQSERKVNKK